MSEPMTIPLSRGLFSVVDQGMYEYLSRFKWSIKDCIKLYAVTTMRIKRGEQIHIAMHHVIIGKPLHKLVVDHINGNSLDNRRENLRIVTHWDNMRNLQTKIKKTSKYLGVRWDGRRQKWSACICGRWLGYFSDEELASRAYQKELLALRGTSVK